MVQLDNLVVRQLEGRFQFRDLFVSLRERRISRDQTLDGLLGSGLQFGQRFPYRGVGNLCLTCSFRRALSFLQPGRNGSSSRNLVLKRV